MRIFIFSFIVPFNPDRAPLVKKNGKAVLETRAKNVYYFDYSKKSDNPEGSLIFYSYPIPIKVLYKADTIVYDEDSSSYCLINKSGYDGTKKLDYEHCPFEIKDEIGH